MAPKVWIRLVRLIVAMAVTVLLRVEAPHACDCLSPSREACGRALGADDIFVARVISNPPIDYSAAHQSNLHAVEMSVSESFRGRANGHVEVFTGTGGGDCGYDFKVGRTYLVYAYRSPTNGKMTTGICSATAPIEEAKADLVFLRGPWQKPSTLGTVTGKVLSPETPSTGGALRTRDVDIELRGRSRRWRTSVSGDGTYSFRVPPGWYEIEVHPPAGYARGLAAETQRPVLLREARGCAVADVFIVRDGRIEGRVLAADGTPVSLMTVSATRPSTGTSNDGHALTDSRGNFQIVALEPSFYTVGLAAWPGKQAARSGLFADPDAARPPFELGPSQRIRVRDIVLPAGVEVVTLEGRVVEEDGSPVVASVFVNQLTHGWGGVPVETTSDGRFAVGAIAGRRVQLSVTTVPTVLSDLGFRLRWARSAEFVTARNLPPIRIVVPR
jgi:hypothetical protein